MDAEVFSSLQTFIQRGIFEFRADGIHSARLVCVSQDQDRDDLGFCRISAARTGLAARAIKFRLCQETRERAENFENPKKRPRNRGRTLLLESGSIVFLSGYIYCARAEGREIKLEPESFAKGIKY